MYTFLVVFQILMVISCFTFVVIMIRQQESALSKLMLCIGFFGVIQNTGYLLELLSRNLEAAMNAVKMEYIGGAFITTILFLFVSRYCGFNVSKLLQWILFSFDCLVLLCVWCYEYTQLFYTDVTFVLDAEIPHLVLKKGPLYAFFVLELFLLMLGCLVHTRISAKKTSSKTRRNNILMLGTCSFFPVIGFLLDFFELTNGFDAVPSSEAIGILGFAVIIVLNHVFDISASAHEKIIKTMDEAVLVLDSDGKFIEANDTALELFHDVIHFEPGKKISDDNLRQKFMESNHFEYVISNHTFEVHANRLWNNKTLEGYAIVFVDVTQNKKQLEEMQILKVNAEKANQTKSDFLARMSHEIRTPINAVLGMNEMVLRESKEEDIKKYSLDIKSSAHALLGIINDILDFSKIESGKLEIVPVEYELNSLLNDLFNMTSIRADEKGLKLEILINPQLPSMLFGDDIRIRQILLNILTNAVKYTQKGTITFSLDGREEGDDIILSFSVKDTGSGIRKEDLPRLYTAFERIDEDKNRNIEGTGLGMNITVQLLKLMGSELRVESVYGEGSTFSFDLRQRIIDRGTIGSFQERAKKAAKEHVYKASFTAPEGRILLVDDNRVNRKVFCGLLKQTQVKITDVGSGKECLEQVAKEKYDLIFLDHMMPEMDGIETLQRMRELENNLCRDTPVVMLTANAIAGAKDKYLQEGFDDFLAKPIEEGKLEEIMCKWMPDSKMIMA